MIGVKTYEDAVREVEALLKESGMTGNQVRGWEKLAIATHGGKGSRRAKVHARYRAPLIRLHTWVEENRARTR